MSTPKCFLVGNLAALKTHKHEAFRTYKGSCGGNNYIGWLGSYIITNNGYSVIRTVTLAQRLRATFTKRNTVKRP